MDGSQLNVHLVDDRPCPTNETVCVIHLGLRVTDPEVVHELELQAEGVARDAYAKHALRIGVLALRQANGSLDATAIQREGERMLAAVRETLTAYTNDTRTAIAQLLGGYLDPASGSLPHRLDALTKRDGEIEALLCKHLDGDQSTIAQTLARQVGEQSPIFKFLSPTEASGLVAVLSRGIEQSLVAQRDDLLKRLQPVVDGTRAAVHSQLTLDDPASPLRRLRDEVLGAMSAFGQSSSRFHSDVRATLEAFRVRREEVARSSAHGHTFEYAVGDALQSEAQRGGDICERLAGTPGREGRKVGDYVVTLGPESAAPGARLVCECKADRGYTEAKALEEIALARKNRDARVGLFVVARESANDGFAALRRVGMDVLVVWDPEDRATDPYFSAAVSIARALIVQEHGSLRRSEGDVRDIEQSVRAIERLVTAAESIAHDAQLVAKRATKIGKTAQVLSERLGDEVERLRGVVEG
jgi:hypothetical protein